MCYNSFVVPALGENEKKLIENCVFKILEQREIHSDKSLFDLYDPTKMPLSLRNEHLELDITIEKLYRADKFNNDDERIQYLMKLYENLKNKEVLI